MSDIVLASLIAAGATILTSLMQLKISFGKELAARAQSSRRKNRVPFIMLAVMLTAAGVGGFAVSHWFTERERITQHELRQELQARITEISRTASQLKQTRLDARAEVETDVLRMLGGRGVIALASVSACKPSRVSDAAQTDMRPVAHTTNSLSAENTTPAAHGPAANQVSAAMAGPPVATTAGVPSVSGATEASAPFPLPAAGAAPTAATTPGSAVSDCTEADATQVTLCAVIPANAVVSNIGLFTRFADAETPWNESGVAPGVEVGQARFSEQSTESLADDGSRQVCHGFANWSAQRARSARMIVRYAIADGGSDTQTHARRESLPPAAGALAVR